MKANWFGDERDLWKWSVTIRAAQPGRRILYAAMLRECRGEEVCPFESSVLSFFRGSHSITEVAQLGTATQVSILPLLEIYHRSKWRSYFAKVVEHLENNSDKGSVVLLDPDTGLEASKRDSSHVHKDEIQLVWSKMRHGDALLVYQHQQRSSHWQQNSADRLANYFQAEVNRVMPHRHKDVCMLQVEKT